MPRFKPGRSGNPKGRPKGAHNLATAFLSEVEQAAPGKGDADGASPRSKLEALIQAQIDKAMAGDNRAIEAVLLRVEQTVAKASEAASQLPAFTAADRETIDEIHRRLCDPEPEPAPEQGPEPEYCP
ncbi:MAG TPA: DUF5681 domain-containing protein [Rhizomicrobium sp.]